MWSRCSIAGSRPLGHLHFPPDTATRPAEPVADQTAIPGPAEATGRCLLCSIWTKKGFGRTRSRRVAPCCTAIERPRRGQSAFQCVLNHFFGETRVDRSRKVGLPAGLTTTLSPGSVAPGRSVPHRDRAPAPRPTCVSVCSQSLLRGDARRPVPKSGSPRGSNNHTIPGFGRAGSLRAAPR